LYGSRDAIVSPTDATLAVQLIARELGVNCDGSDFTESVRVHTLRKIIDARFGASAAWQGMNKAWRAAPASPGAPAPNIDQSQLPPGSLSDSSSPRWIESLYDSSRVEREWLEDLGIGRP
jgi:hypothetical protein